MGCLKISEQLLVLAGLCFAGVTAGMAADLYGFADEQGVLHLSTTPYDAKFALLMREADKTATDDGAGQSSPAAFERRPYNKIIRAAAGRHQLDEALLHAVIEAESRYNPNAISPKGAIGLMQLMPGTAKRYGVTDLKDPTENLRAGASYLRDLLTAFNNDLSLTLAAYNSGENAVLRHGTIPPYPETQGFVAKVIGWYKPSPSCYRVSAPSCGNCLP